MAEVKPKVVVISGITASGKTDLSVKIAKRFNGEIISCDSRQVYKYLDIGTAKITREEMCGVNHYMLDICDPTKNVRYTLADFVRETERAIDYILYRGKLPILVGGTGLYSRAVIEGYSFNDAPEKSGANPRHSGKKAHDNKPKYDILQICLTPPNEVIAGKVRRRNETRLADGMIAETEKLLTMGVKPEFLLNLGLEYKLNVQYLNGEFTLDEYKKRLYTQTMQFIKRQRTWYRKEDPKVTYYLTEPDKYFDAAADLIKNFMFLSSV
jgi:tRNA dimethylallyltransferase